MWMSIYVHIRGVQTRFNKFSSKYDLNKLFSINHKSETLSEFHTKISNISTLYFIFGKKKFGVIIGMTYFFQFAFAPGPRETVEILIGTDHFSPTEF